MTADDLIGLDWLVEIATNGDLARRKVSEIASLPEGMQFSVSGTVSPSGYLYVLQENDTEFAILHPEDGNADFEEDGTQRSLPANDPRYTAPLTGALRVLLAPNPVSDDEWPDLLGGREPKRKKNDGSTT